MPSKVRIGLVGAGSITKEHVKVIQAIEGLEAVAITSRTKLKAEQLAKEFGIASCHDDIDGLVKEANPDALVIVVSEEHMEAVTRKALSFGLPLLLEKPVALTAAKNLELAQIAKQKNVPTMVGHNRRYYSIFHKGLEVIRHHGRLLGIHVEGHERIWKQRVVDNERFKNIILPAWVVANSTHTIDLLRFFGGDVVQVNAQANALHEPRVDQITAVMRLKDDVLAQYEAFWYSPGGWRVVLYGEGVTVEFKPLESGRWMDTQFQVHEITPEPYDLQFKPGFYGQMQAFAELVRTGKKTWPMADLEDSYKTMSLIEEMTGKVVHLKKT